MGSFLTCVGGLPSQFVYRLACQLDLEGIVAKKADSPYEDNWSDPYWIKIKNPQYSQKEGRADLFKRAG
jgi:ATP-dependent DNA ligase